jgi:hypothetical protein
MPIHNWTRVDAGIFHHFHHGWIEEIQRALNAGLLPDDYYALAEQHAAGFGPDVLTLQGPAESDDEDGAPTARTGGGLALQLAPPKVRITAETDLEFYRRKQNAVAVRHVSGDRLVAIVEVVSPGNKTGKKVFQAFVDKATDFLEKQIHLLLLDLQPPSSRDPQGIHGAIWEDITGQSYTAPPEKPLTLAAYESAMYVRAYVEPVAIGDTLPDMPLFLEPRRYVNVPLEATYQSAYRGVPRRWRRVLDASGT